MFWLLLAASLLLLFAADRLLWAANRANRAGRRLLAGFTPADDDSDVTGCRCGTCWDCVTASVYALFPQHPDVGFEMSLDDVDAFTDLMDSLESGEVTDRGETQ